MKAENIIRNLINLVGVTTGIIILSIGTIIVLESFFKLYIFDLKEDRYSRVSFYECEQYNIDSIRARMLVGSPIDIQMVKPVSQDKLEKIKELTPEDKEFLAKKYKECVNKVKMENQDNFQRREKMDIAEGIAFMVVGAPLIYFYQRRRRNNN